MDLLASQYGWAKRDIFDDTYFDELFDFVQLINKRQYENYFMLLTIAHNPNSKEPEKLMQMFDDKIKAIEAVSSNESLPTKKSDEDLDREGFERMKLVMSQNPRMIVK